MKDYYQILEIPYNSSHDVIKKAYRTLSKKYHPDINPTGMEQFKNINEANNTLSDPIKRSAYNAKYLLHFKKEQSTTNANKAATNKTNTRQNTSTVKQSTQKSSTYYNSTKTNSTITVNGVTINVSGNNTTTNVKVVNGKVIIETTTN